MFFSKTFATIALAAVAAAQSSAVFFTNTQFNVQAGQEFTITYGATDLTQAVTILLRQGPSGALHTVETITSSATGGSFRWTVPATLASATNYALEIEQGDQVNYSKEFPITGGTAQGSSTISSAAAYTSTAVVAPTYGSVTSGIASNASSMSSATSSFMNAYNASSVVVITSTAPSNNSMTGAPVASGTGNSIPIARNTTFSSATLSATGAGATAGAGNTVVPPTAGGGAAASSVVASNPNAATSYKSSFALVFGVAAAVAYLA